MGQFRERPPGARGAGGETGLGAVPGGESGREVHPEVESDVSEGAGSKQ